MAATAMQLPKRDQPSYLLKLIYQILGYLNKTTNIINENRHTCFLCPFENNGIVK